MIEKQGPLFQKMALKFSWNLVNPCNHDFFCRRLQNRWPNRWKILLKSTWLLKIKTRFNIHIKSSVEKSRFTLKNDGQLLDVADPS